ncbi:MAG: HU family DNA-binding protein, partial [Desulfobulbales bacterium]
MKRSNITRKDLAKAINEKLGFSQRSAEEIVDTVFSIMKETLM